MDYKSPSVLMLVGRVYGGLKMTKGGFPVSQRDRAHQVRIRFRSKEM